jgi:hypothetical protein
MRTLVCFVLAACIFVACATTDGGSGKALSLDQAIADFTQAITLDPEDASAYYGHLQRGLRPDYCRL